MALIVFPSISGVRLKFISPLKDQTVKEGETAHFDFELSHEDMPVTWYKNDKKIHNSRTVLISVEGKKHKLEIREVTLDDISEIKAEVKALHTKANLKVLGNLCCHILLLVGSVSIICMYKIHIFMYFSIYVFHVLIHSDY